LFANMMSGHCLLKILAGFSWTMLATSGLFLPLAHFLPLLVIFAIVGLELAIAFLQAYVFTVLLCIYLNDALSLH
jgi:F-type H+-transporting ATPase subunit a